MKHYLLLVAFVITLTGCSSEQNDLYKKADSFVESLYGTYESYGLAGMGRTEYTEGGRYKIMPIGRLVNVRIESAEASIKDYEKLKNKLSRHFKKDSRVKNVYICQGGTVMIDCRN